MRLFLFTLLSLLGLATQAPAGESRWQIRWEIVNRFAPFELLSDPEAYFQAYRLAPGESWEQWHERKWREMGPGLASPYARALMTGGPLPWDEGGMRTEPELLRFLREEDDPATTLPARLWFDSDEPCTWSLDGILVARAHCNETLDFDLPLAGMRVDVFFPRVSEGDARGHPTALRQVLRPEHMVIVALGDSYGSGEGNPDIPAIWRAGIAPEGPDVNWLITGHNLVRRARWLSETCHRSFFSHQSLTALGLASQDPHRFVSFLHYACSGAEIFRGLIGVQENPTTGRGFLALSQLNAARADLCRAPGAGYHALPDAWRRGTDLSAFARRDGIELRPGSARDWLLRREAGRPRDGILDCPEGALRRPDLVLLSIGGNDVGFGELVHYFVAPVGETTRTGTELLLPGLCPAPPYRADAADAPHAAAYCAGLDRAGRPDAGDLIGGARDKGGIGARLGLAIAALRYGLEVPARRIVMAHYPDPLRAREAGGDGCWRVGAPAEVAGGPARDPASPWNGLKVADPTGFFRNDGFTLTGNEAAKLLGQFDDLRFQVTLAARREGFRLACGARDVMVGRGWWLGRHLNLPSDTGPGLAPWQPAAWQPYRYEAEGRAVRTGNDSVLTQATGRAEIMGTAHPNLTGHALIADQVLARLLGEEERTRAADRVALSPDLHPSQPF